MTARSGSLRDLVLFSRSLLGWRLDTFAVVLLLLAQLGCVPGDLSTVCHCKMGQVTACMLLRQTDPLLAAELEKALAQAQAMKALEQESSARQATDRSEAGAQASSDAPEPPDCKGQEHHVISRPIAKVLDEHETLGGHYKARDPRFVVRAKDEAAHCGYQDWHRKADAEVIEWLRRFDRATPKQFEAFLRSIYNRPELRARFPLGF